MSKTNVSSSGGRILRVLKAPRGHAPNSISSGELVVVLHELPASTNRTLNILIEKGLALRLENKCFTSGIQLLQVTVVYSNEVARARNRINEISQRVISGGRL